VSVGVVCGPFVECEPGGLDYPHRQRISVDIRHGNIWCHTGVPGVERGPGYGYQTLSGLKTSQGQVNPRTTRERDVFEFAADLSTGTLLCRINGRGPMTPLFHRIPDLHLFTYYAAATCWSGPIALEEIVEDRAAKKL
jgi:hypothetical protein